MLLYIVGVAVTAGEMQVSTVASHYRSRNNKIGALKILPYAGPSWTFEG